MIDLIPLSGSTEPQQTDYSQIEQQLLLDHRTPPRKPPIALSLDYHQFGQEIKPTVWGHYQGLSAVVGASKSMKSRLAYALEAAWMGGRANERFENWKGWNSSERYCIHFDTEQSSWHAHQVGVNVRKIVGADCKHLNYTLVELSVEERIGFIEHVLLQSKYVGKIGWVTIDQVADLVLDVNNLTEANLCVGRLLRWASQTKAHILCVIHATYGSFDNKLKATGHLGSAVTKKCETVASLHKSGSSTTVKPDFTRNYPFNEFGFELDEHGLPRQSNHKEVPF